MVTLLQFVVFMRAWQIILPNKANAFLKALKALALFEFLPTDKLDEWIMDLFGIEYQKEDEDGFDSDEESSSLFDQLAVFILAGAAIIVLLLILILLRLCIKRSEKVRSFYDKLKKKLFYATFINYILLGALKIQISIGGILFMGSLIPIREVEVDQKPELSMVIFGITVLSILALTPIFFGLVLYANRQSLD